MIGWILIGLLILMLAYLLLAPFGVRFDSREAAATVKLFHLGSGRVCYKAESLWLEVRVLGLRFKWDVIVLAANMAVRSERKTLMSKQNREVLGQHKSKAEKPTKSVGKRVPMRRVLAVLRSFEIPECILQLDTGSPAQNGILFPLAWWIGKWSGRPVGINFQGQNVCVLEIKNTVGRLLRAYVRGK